MSKYHPLKTYCDNDKIDIQEIMMFLTKQGYIHCRILDNEYVLSKGDIVVISKEETATYKQVKELLENLKLDIDDFSMTLESSDNKKECEEFIKSLEDGKKHSL